MSGVVSGTVSIVLSPLSGVVSGVVSGTVSGVVSVVSDYREERDSPPPSPDGCEITALAPRDTPADNRARQITELGHTPGSVPYRLQIRGEITNPSGSTKRRRNDVGND